MPGYVNEAGFDRMLDDYPIGAAFLAGPARLSAAALRALQERRFRVVLARAWQVPFYDRRWRAVGLEPGDICGFNNIKTSGGLSFRIENAKTLQYCCAIFRPLCIFRHR